MDGEISYALGPRMIVGLVAGGGADQAGTFMGLPATTNCRSQPKWRLTGSSVQCQHVVVGPERDAPTRAMMRTGKDIGQIFSDDLLFYADVVRTSGRQRREHLIWELLVALGPLTDEAPTLRATWSERYAEKSHTNERPLMTVPWSLTTTAPQRIDTTIGVADDHDAAVTAVLFAAQDAIAELSAAPAARYDLRAADELVALIQTCADEDGRPDHVSTSELIQRIEGRRYLSASPY